MAGEVGKGLGWGVEAGRLQTVADHRQLVGQPHALAGESSQAGGRHQEGQYHHSHLDVPHSRDTASVQTPAAW
jgi:hypothetical protein